MDRRATAAIAAGAAALGAALWTTVVEPRRLRIRRVDVGVPGWPEGLAGLRVALIADLHAGAPHLDEARVSHVVDAVNAARPDVVALLGDYVDPDAALGETVSPEAVARRLGGLDAPLGTFAVLGNHDWLADGERVRRALREQLIDVLENDAASVDFAGEVLWLVGLADVTTRAPDVATPFSLVPESAPLIVLSHNPDLVRFLPERPMLMLAEHIPGAGTRALALRTRSAPELEMLKVAGSIR